MKDNPIPLLFSTSEEYNLKNPTICQCGSTRDILISFPGTYEKDREMQAMLSMIWRYLAYKISCVITLGISGAWDPILIAFISNLLGERKIPLVDVNKYPKNSYLVKEIVKTKVFNAVSIKQTANAFMKEFVKKYKTCNLTPISFEFKSFYDNEGKDYHWDQLLDCKITKFEEELIGSSSVSISKQFSQLGLISRWLGVDKNKRKDHNRLNHSKGMMKIASFIYEEACKKSNRKPNDNEKQFLRIAALLHDIGHLPFCHLIEEIFKELNWKPGGYIESFGHGWYTKGKIDKLVRETKLESYLKEIGYETADLVRLINGEFGVGFLDAIINSPIDADKIDYVFRDGECTNTRIFLEEKDFLFGLVKEIQITSEDLLAFSGHSAKLAIELLDERKRLYDNLYFERAIKFLESSAVRFIITTYFVHKYNTINWEKEEVSKAIEDVKKITHGISDLGALRIQLAIDNLEDLVKNNKSEDDIEFAILGKMKDYLLSKPIRKEIKVAINRCYDLIENTNTKDELLKKESDHFIDRKLGVISPERLQDVRKKVMLRFPGAVLVNIVPSLTYLSIPENRREKERNDGTSEHGEYILIPSGNPRYWRKGRALANTSLIDANLEKKEKGTPNIYLYRIGEEDDVKQAVDLFVRLIREEKAIIEEEEVE